MSEKSFTLPSISYHRFYRMPKFLFEREFRSLSSDARILYSLLRDRLDLSRKNKWKDKHGIYLIYTRQDMCEILGCTQPTVRRAIKQLKEAGLMDERRQGLNKPNLIYIYDCPEGHGGTAANVRFYQTSKFLFEGDLRSLSNDARVLYSLLRDRLDLSRKNNWMDNLGSPYLIYTRQDMCNMLGCSQPTIRRAVKQLKEAELIDERRQRLNKPNLIYLYPAPNPTPTDRTSPSPAFNWSERFFHSESTEAKNSFAPECNNSSFRDCKNLSLPYNRGFNKTNTSYTDNQSIDSIDSNKKIKSSNRKNLANANNYATYKGCRELLKDNIGYDCLAHDKPYHKHELDEIVDIMAEAVCSSCSTIRVNSENKPAEIVKSRILKLNKFHMEYVFECLDKNTSNISNIRAYLLSVLFNAPSTINNYYRAAVNHDFYGRKDNEGVDYKSKNIESKHEQNYFDKYDDPRMFKLEM